MDERIAASARAWALELTGRPSVNGTADEARFAPWLLRRLQERLGPALLPDDALLIPVPADPHGRAALLAVVRASGRTVVRASGSRADVDGHAGRAVLLTGHFDTVHVEDYRELAPLALQPEALRDALVHKLRRADAGPAEALALADLESGAFLPGRGLLDMKAGLAAGLAVLEHWARSADAPGALMFLAVPDEEANSAGARAGAAALPAILRRLGLELDLVVNLDATVDRGDGTLGRRIGLGTVGKLLPSALVIGQPTHAAEALRGLNAGALAGALAAEVEWSPRLTDRTGDETGAPPTLLGIADDRTAYDVTTPAEVWLYWNVLVHRRRPDEVMVAMQALAEEAVLALTARLPARAAAVAGLAPAPTPVAVSCWSALHRAVTAADAAAAAELDAHAAELLAGGTLDLPAQCRRLTSHLWALSGRTGPAIILGFASMPYMATRLAGERGERIGALVREAAALAAKRAGCSITVDRYFPAISDISFLGQASLPDLAAVAAETPCWTHGIAWPAEGAILGVPAINAGPWGRDYHTPLERLHTGYAFEVLPALLIEIATRTLAASPVAPPPPH